jgi:hypothetical protein
LYNTFKFKGGALGIAQIALATNQEGTVGGIDAAISWGVCTVTGIGAAALVAVSISNPIGIAIVVPPLNLKVLYKIQKTTKPKNSTPYYTNF